MPLRPPLRPAALAIATACALALVPALAGAQRRPSVARADDPGRAPQAGRVAPRAGGPATTPPAGAAVLDAAGFVDPTAVRRLLRNEAFVALDAVLASFERDAATEPTVEHRLFDAYDAFAVLDTALDAHLDRWVASAPASPRPLLARAVYRSRQGRPLVAAYPSFTPYDGWEPDVSADESGLDDQPVAAGEDDVVDDVAEALRRDRQSAVAYRLLLLRAARTGDEEGAREQLQNALFLLPASLVLRQDYASGLSPWMGRSYAGLRELADEARPYGLRQPRLLALSGYVAAERALERWARGDTARALAQYGRALEAGDDWHFRRQRAELHLIAGRYHLALVDYNAALRQRPHDAGLLVGRARAYAAMSRQACGGDSTGAAMRADWRARALADARRAEELEPGDARFAAPARAMRREVRTTGGGGQAGAGSSPAGRC